MTDDTLKKVDEKDELVCEHCGQLFHYDHRNHCWKCDSLTCPYCSTAENICPECTQQILPENIEPMLATIGKLQTDQNKWAYEFKWDGIRAISYWNGQKLRIQSRNLIDMTFRYPELRDLGKFLQEDAIVDGEIIALDNENKPSFSILQKRMHISPAKAKTALPKMRIFYYIFDLLFLNGKPLTDHTYLQRRQLLETLEIDHPACRIPPSYTGDPDKIISAAKQFALEGIICKKIDSVYSPGKRSNDWIKVKFVNSKEFVIGGFKYSQNTTNRIGSLQLGAFDDQLNLHYVGAAGTGFSQYDHDLLLSKLKPIITQDSPFYQTSVKDIIFTKPVYVAQIEYRRWPKDSLLQQSAYKGLRTDKHPSQIKLKEP